MRSKQSQTDSDDASDWDGIWDARLKAFEEILGRSADTYHAVMPFGLGDDADVVVFPDYVDGVAYVTADLTGPLSEQPPNDLAQYELMICLREEAEWAPTLLSRLSRYALEAQLNANETMDWPMFEMSNIVAFAFALPEPVYEFSLLDEPATLLLLIGITAEELALAR